MDSSIHTITIPDEFTISIKADRGIFTYNEDNHHYYLFTIRAPLSTRTVTPSDWKMSFLGGFRIDDMGRDSKPVSIHYLEENFNDIKDGESFKIFINGEAFLATKDSSISYSIRSNILYKV